MATVTHVMNQDPRLTRYLVKEGAFAHDPLTVIDAGAKGGFEKHWDWYGDQIRLIGFEPNPVEYEKLAALSVRTRRYFETALSDRKGSRKLYVYAYASASSFLQPNVRFLVRLPDLVNFRIEKEIMVPTDTIDAVMRSSGIDRVDFIKIDTQGTELEILKGARHVLSSVLGVATECAFNPFYEGETTFADIDRFLRPPFSLFSLPTFNYLRTALSPYREAAVPRNTTPFGQICWADALYLRDAVDDMGSGAHWNRIRLLKLASLMELFSFADCAGELIEVAYERGFLSAPDHSAFMRELTGGGSGSI